MQTDILKTNFHGGKYKCAIRFYLQHAASRLSHDPCGKTTWIEKHFKTKHDIEVTVTVEAAKDLRSRTAAAAGKQDKNRDWVTSNLGALLFKNTTPMPEKNRTYTVLIWKYWDWLRSRHLIGFDGER
ncbi:hypothetical protein ACJJTC_013169, partial [Scirpophaga incertulas]